MVRVRWRGIHTQRVNNGLPQLGVNFIARSNVVKLFGTSFFPSSSSSINCKKLWYLNAWKWFDQSWREIYTIKSRSFCTFLFKYKIQLEEKSHLLAEFFSRKIWILQKILHRLNGSPRRALETCSGKWPNGRD